MLNLDRRVLLGFDWLWFLALLALSAAGATAMNNGKTIVDILSLFLPLKLDLEFLVSFADGRERERRLVNET